MHLANLLLITGALGAVAHPGHSHAHRRAHEKREQFVKAVHTTIKTTAAAATSSAAAAATSLSASSSSSSTSTGYKEFCSGSSKRATAAEIAYTGNTGTTWGCNMMTIDSSIASLYNYTTAYTNVDSSDYEVVCFNKIGPDGGINGFFGYSAVSFTLAAGQTQYVAFEANSQGACAFGKGSSVELTSYGEWAGTWVEWDFDNTSNGGYSGADCSSLVAQSASMTVYGCKVCSPDSSTDCSTILPDGTGTNAYTKGLEAADGLGLQINPGNAALVVSVGYSG